MSDEQYFREVDGSDYGQGPTIQMRQFRVVSRTPKGAWITDHWDRDGEYKRFVLDGVGKRFAYPTKELARESYIIRKQRQIKHCANTHDKAVKLLALAETGALPEPDFIMSDLHDVAPPVGAPACA